MTSAKRTKSAPDPHDHEIDQNYKAFEKMLPSILVSHQNRFALMKNKKVLGYYSTSADAYSAAVSFISDGLFSIQQVTDSSINLGFFTDAVVIV